MQKFRVLWLCLLLIPLNSMGFEGIGTIGGRAAGMGKASVALSDFWAIQNNPAGIALEKGLSFGIAYQNRFMMNELSLKSAAASYSLNFGVLGISVNQFGYSQYNENKIGITYARAFGEKYRLGLQLDYLTNHYADAYESFHNVTFEIGAQADITEQLTAAAYIFNPPRITRSDFTNERIPIIMRFGLAYAFTPELLTAVEFSKGLDFEPDFRAGLEYILNDYFVVRSGIGVNPGVFTFGAGYHSSGFQFDLAGELHPVLGASLQAGLVYSFSLKEK